MNSLRGLYSQDGETIHYPDVVMADFEGKSWKSGEFYSTAERGCPLDVEKCECPKTIRGENKSRIVYFVTDSYFTASNL